MFDTSKYWSLDDNGKLELLKAHEGNIEISDYYEYLKFERYVYALFLHKYNHDVTIELVKKRPWCRINNSTPNLFQRAALSCENTNLLLEILNIYNDNGWIKEDQYKTIIHDVLSYNDTIYKRENPDLIFNKIIEIYDNNNMPINVKNGWRSKDIDTLACVAQYGNTSNFVKLLKLYIERGLEVDNNIFNIFFNNKYNSMNTSDEQDMIYFIDYSADKLIMHTNVNTIAKCIAFVRNWNIVKKIIYAYKYSLHEDNVLLTAFGKYLHDVNAIKYIIDYYCDNKLNIYANPNVHRSDDGIFFTDCVLMYNTRDVIDYVRSRGIIFHNHIIKLYVPCPKCHNLEGHNCNWRNISTEYISLSRYNLKLEDINTNNDIINILNQNNKDDDDFYASWYEFNGTADEKEVYVAPGIDRIIKLDDTDSDDSDDSYGHVQHEFKTPPIKYDIAYYLHVIG